MAWGRQRLLASLLSSLPQPNRYLWHAKSSLGRQVPQLPSFSLSLFWEVHLTAIPLSPLLQFLLILFCSAFEKSAMKHVAQLPSFPLL